MTPSNDHDVKWGLVQILGGKERDFLTFQGKVVYHSSGVSDAKAEMEWVWAPALHRGRVALRQIPPSIPVHLLLPMRFHPEFQGVRFDPLNKDDFWKPTRDKAIVPALVGGSV